MLIKFVIVAFAKYKPFQLHFKLFQRTLKQFEKLMKRGAFIDQYKQMPMFKENLDEFDNAREVNTEQFQTNIV